MESEADYQLVGKFIYGFQRVLFGVEHFCNKLERRLGNESSTRKADLLAEPGGRIAALLVQHYGADSVIAHEFLALSDALRLHDARFAEITEKSQTGRALAGSEPDEAETAHLLSCQQELDRIWRLIDPPEREREVE